MGPKLFVTCILGTLTLLAGCDDGTRRAIPNHFDDRSAIDCYNAADCDRVLVAAHRGFKLRAPENTIASVRDAIAVGADIVEIDVRHTLDGELVIMHDASADRTTDGSGKVSGMTLEEVRALHIKQKPGEERPDGERVPTFEEIISETRDKIAVDIDMKTDRVDLLVAALKKYDVYDQVHVHKGEDDVALELAKADSRIRVMPNATDADEVNAWADQINLFVVEVDADLANNMPDGFMAAANARGTKVHLNFLGLPDVAAILSGDTSLWKERAETGVHIVQTDFPDVLIPFLDEIGYR